MNQTDKQDIERCVASGDLVMPWIPYSTIFSWCRKEGKVEQGPMEEIDTFMHGTLEVQTLVCGRFGGACSSANPDCMKMRHVTQDVQDKHNDPREPREKGQS